MAKGNKPQRKMFITFLPGEELQVVLSDEGKVQEYYVELLHQSKTKGNIYKGVINNIDPALQAAFVSYGANKNGFLQVDEVHPEYYLRDVEPKKGYRYPPLHKVLKPGQEVLVQVVKEPTGNKGAFLTTYLSLAGRFFVLTLGREQTGVSRKIEDDKERVRLKEIVDEFNLGEGMGVIVRTVSVGISKAELSRDLNFLKRLWLDVRKKGVSAKAPDLIYQEKDLAFRSVRDYLTPDVAEIWVDHPEIAKQVQEFVSLVFPRRKNIVKKHTETDQTIFQRFDLVQQISTIYERKVPLPSGGELVFDQAEALMAVDINSGKIGGEKNFKEMALRTNMEAAEEIARQLRLRDVGGQVVIDFIEMKDGKHVREVEKTLRQAVKSDKARIDIGRISKFGLLEMVRQRIASSAISLSTEPCPSCQGMGVRRNLEWQALSAIKEIYAQIRSKRCPEVVEYRAKEELAFYLLNQKREKLKEMEQEANKSIVILSAHATS
ncbi:MAG: ribonuclease E/G [Desulfovibrionales bacterium]